jgi:aryl-alcohol dehydrogenase-like predicted oxidoreductase
MEEIVLATKVNFPMSPGPNMGGLSRKHVVQACEASLKRLGVSTIDLYQIHRFDHAVPLDETLAALDLLVKQGKVRFIGASSGPAFRFAKALALSDAKGFARFASMQNHYNLLYREEEREMLPLCAEEGIGVLPWSPLARGLLAGSRKNAADKAATARAASDEYTRNLYDHPSDDSVIEAVKSVAAARGLPPAAIALAWLLSRPAVTAPIVGATKLEHLETALSALDVTLTEDEIGALEAPYRPHGVRGFK